MQRRDALKAGIAAAAWAAWPEVARTATNDWAPLFAHLSREHRQQLADPALRVQLLWQRIDRGANGEAHLPPPLAWQVDRRRWFSPASTVKLPMALLAAEVLLQHPEGFAARLRLDAPPATGVWDDQEPLAEVFWNTLWRLLIVSENTPYNRLFEFLGADAVHARLEALGLPDVRLLSRLGSAVPEANRRTGGGALEVPVGGDDLGWIERLRWPMRQAMERTFPFGAAPFGEAWQQDDGSTAIGPRDMRFNNFMALEDGLAVLTRLLFPEAHSAAARWALPPSARDAMARVMALWPRESPLLATTNGQPLLDDHYAKFFVVGDGVAAPGGFRSIGKTGEAYGFHSEIALLTDTDGDVETLLAAVVYANADGVVGDDRYDYDRVSRPLLAALGRAALAAERERRRRHRAGASLWSRRVGLA